MGFIAQKVEKIFPSLVSHYADTARGTDINLMDYTGFGVIAIKGIQELQQQMHDKDTTISYQQKQIDELKNMLLALQQKVESCSPCGSSSAQSTNHSSVTLTNNASLEQNIPNPFTNTTVINYTLPQKINTAQIIITDNNGKTIKQINISGAGKGSLTVDASTLMQGAYHYALFVDGKMIGTKQMVLAK